MVGGQNAGKSDERFAHIPTDPRFKTSKKSHHRIKADARWHGMLKDERFTFKATSVDKRGRPRYTSMKEDLRRIYDISDSSNDEDQQESETDESSDSDNEINSAEIEKQKKLGVDVELDVARGQGLEDSSDDDDDDSSNEDIKDQDLGDDVEHPWGEMDKDAKETTDPTHRLAACNMDWNRVRAVDLLMLFNSFKPEMGVVKSVTIYPSEYGVQRLQEEDRCGPLELADIPPKGDNDDDEADGAEFHREKLRQYELNRLRYYYAVIECDSSETANVIYEKCDGIEFENSASRLDLRFIPDDMTFDQKPKSTASSLPDVAKYQPPAFTSSALQCSSVKLTWDETPLERVSFMARDFSKDELAEQDLAAYIASDTDSDEDQCGYGDIIDDSEWRKKAMTIEDGAALEDEEASTLKKFKSLVQDLHSKKDRKSHKEFEMEVTWEPGLKEKTEKKLKHKEDKNKKLSPWEEYRQKKKIKRLEKKEARIAKKTLNDEDRVEKKSKVSKLKKERKEKKKLRKEKIASKAVSTLTDNRFSAVYNNPRFNIDQSAPEYRQSGMMESILAEKVKRRTKD